MAGSRGGESAGGVTVRLSSCIGYIASSTVAATFHVGGGGRFRTLPSSGSQPPSEPSSFCSATAFDSTISCAPSAACGAPVASHSTRSRLARQRWRSSSLEKTIATVSGWPLPSGDGRCTQWKHDSCTHSGPGDSPCGPTTRAAGTASFARCCRSVSARIVRPSRSHWSTSAFAFARGLSCTAQIAGVGSGICVERRRAARIMDGRRSILRRRRSSQLALHTSIHTVTTLKFAAVTAKNEAICGGEKSSKQPH